MACRTFTPRWRLVATATPQCRSAMPTPCRSSSWISTTHWGPPCRRRSLCWRSGRARLEPLSARFLTLTPQVLHSRLAQQHHRRHAVHLQGSPPSRSIQGLFCDAGRATSITACRRPNRTLAGTGPSRSSRSVTTSPRSSLQHPCRATVRAARRPRHTTRLRRHHHVRPCPVPVGLRFPFVRTSQRFASAARCDVPWREWRARPSRGSPTMRAPTGRR